MENQLKVRSERFCQAVAQGSSYSTAARIAGYSAHSSRAAGSRLMRNETVRRRVRELVNESSTHTELFDRAGNLIGYFAPVGK